MIAPKPKAAQLVDLAYSIAGVAAGFETVAEAFGTLRKAAESMLEPVDDPKTCVGCRHLFQEQVTKRWVFRGRVRIKFWCASARAVDDVPLGLHYPEARFVQPHALCRRQRANDAAERLGP